MNDWKRVKIETVTVDNLPQVAAELLQKANAKVWLLQGEMGAGKTTLVKSIAKVLGATDVVASPTFSIVHEYSLPEDKKIYHFDFYRLAQEEEAYQIGVEEYFDSGEYCFLEWAEKIPNLLPNDYFAIRIEPKDKNIRIIYYATHE